MGQTLYGARLWQNENGAHTLRYDIIGNNSEVFAPNDIVSVGSGNELQVSTRMIIGVVVKTATMSSTNETVAKKYPGYIPMSHDSVWLMGTNSDLTGNAADAGTFYQIVGATGAQQVDVTSGTKAITLSNVGIVKVDPYEEGGSGSGSGLRKCLVKFVNTSFHAKDAS